MIMLKPSVWNAWLLSLPFFAIGVLFMGMKTDIAKRMSDMTGYTAREKSVTVAASIAPYPFMVATVWTPFTPMLFLLCLGMSLYIIGMALFAMSLKVIIRTPQDELFNSGPYRFTRNPLYVAATIVFMGICLATANIVLAGYLAIAVILQHFMILAEERVCMQKYGKAYETYMQKVPRYLYLKDSTQPGAAGDGGPRR
jgi:protein-S-isoprenylcysteine O-methyltransferase Ste14